MGEARIYTIGFSGRRSEMYSELGERGVRRIVDVRRRAIGGNQRWDGSWMAASAQAAGLGYVHRPDVGIPRRLCSAHWLNLPAMLKAYRDHLEADPELLPGIADFVRPGDCLVCSCADAPGCHRSVLVDALVEGGHLRGWRVVHIAAPSLPLMGREGL